MQFNAGTVRAGPDGSRSETLVEGGNGFGIARHAKGRHAEIVMMGFRLRHGALGALSQFGLVGEAQRHRSGDNDGGLAAQNTLLHARLLAVGP